MQTNMEEWHLEGRLLNIQTTNVKTYSSLTLSSVNPSSAGPISIWGLTVVIAVHADVLAPNGARTSAATVLNTMLGMFLPSFYNHGLLCKTVSSLYIFNLWYMMEAITLNLVASQGLKTFEHQPPVVMGTSISINSWKSSPLLMWFLRWLIVHNWRTFLMK